MSKTATGAVIPPEETVGLDRVLCELAEEAARLAEQCMAIQSSISTMLDNADHPDLGAEIHMLQDIDRIQQTLADLAAVLSVTRAHAAGRKLLVDEVGGAIRLESLRHRLGLVGEDTADDPAPHSAEVTWL